MKSAFTVVLFLTLLSLSALCSAQQSHIPFAQLELEARNTPVAEPSATTGTTGSSSSTDAEAPSAGEPASYSTLSVPTATRHRHVISSLLVMNSLHIGTAALDIALTKRCIDNHTCREGNPMMPSSVGGQIGVDFALVSYSSLVSYKLKKRNSRMWWLSPTLGTATHMIGIASNITR